MRHVLALFLLVAVAGACASAAPRAVQITIHYSHYSTTQVDVPAGVPITLTIRNDDPIDHEWIVGDAAVQQKHRTGTELLHPSIPTELMIPAGQTRVTTITFGQAGSLQYICHLPAHEAYGMVGTVTIR